MCVEICCIDGGGGGGGGGQTVLGAWIGIEDICHACSFCYTYALDY